jgi:hypothetical protein
MSAKRNRFDVGTMMKARKESKLLHEKIAKEKSIYCREEGLLAQSTNAGKETGL